MERGEKGGHTGETQRIGRVRVLMSLRGLVVISGGWPMPIQSV